MRLLLDLVTEPLDAEPGLDVLVTHDVILAVVAGAILGVDVVGPGWPGFLEGLFLWIPAAGSLAGAWRGARFTAGERQEDCQ